MRIIYIFIAVMILFSCSIEDLFEQPDVEVTGYRLTSLPLDTAHLNIAIRVTNRDHRKVHVADVDYTVELEGIILPTQNALIDQTMYPDSTVELDLPLSIAASDGMKILSKLESGKTLDYTVSGQFHADDPVLKLFDLPLNISGTAEVDAGYEDFYEMPDVTVAGISGNYTEDSPGSRLFDFNVSCHIENRDSRSVIIDEIVYTVFVEDIPSESHRYSEHYMESFRIDGYGTDSLKLPVFLSLDTATAAHLAAAIQDGDIDYRVEGVFHASGVDSIDTDFTLPLYLSGAINADILSTLFLQPAVRVTGYRLLELPGDTAFLDIDMLLTNRDTRTAHIHDIAYQVVVDGISALPEEVIIDTYIPEDTIRLTLPLTLLTEDAIQILSKLDAGETLEYHVTGTFHMADPVLGIFDLPLNIRGSAEIEVGYDDFYEQPEVSVNSVDGSYRMSGFTTYILDFDVNCTVSNIDSRGATIDEIEYTVTVEGVKSNKHYYSNSYSENFVIAANDSEDLVLPVTFNLGLSGGAAMVTAVSDGMIDYVIEGTFHVIFVDQTEVDFNLPLYVTGSVPATMAGP